MAFQAPNTGQERQRKNILEQLEEQKKRLRMQNQGNSGGPPAASIPVAGTSIPQIPPPALPAGVEVAHMSQSQRAALQHAHANSVGYFITQDSSFGNLILPVLPRLEK